MKLLILDVYGTIVARGARPIVRNGLFDLLDCFGNIAVATDDPDREVIESYLETLGMRDRVGAIYTGQDLIRLSGYPDERKDLERICRECGADVSETLFVSDGKRDREDAQRTNVRFAHVPYFEKAEESFSLTLLATRMTFPIYLDLRKA